MGNNHSMAGVSVYHRKQIASKRQSKQEFVDFVESKFVIRVTNNIFMIDRQISLFVAHKYGQTNVSYCV